LIFAIADEPLIYARDAGGEGGRNARLMARPGRSCKAKLEA